MPARKEWITKNCTNCNKSISRLPSQFYGRNTFCSHRCNGKYNARYGKENSSWKGGRTQETDKGYILICKPDHPRARKNGYVLEHIVVMEQELGRPLEKNERIHHIDHNPANNKSENLKLYSSNGQHLKKEEHHRQKHKPCKCGRPHKGHGLCSRHLAQLRTTGETWDFENKLIKRNRPEFCYCGQPVKCRDLCNKHYQQWYKEHKGTNCKKNGILGTTKT